MNNCVKYVYAPLRELIEGLPEAQQQRWERLWMVSDARLDRIHPVIYSHPVTGEKTLCFHLGMTEAFVWDYGTPVARRTDQRETIAILREIHHEFVKDNGAIQYSHKWTEGDFIISDNLSVGHEATEDTQLPRSQVGLRVLHRTTIRGTVPPAKNYDVPVPREPMPLPGAKRKDEL
ncbi:hypothetical protein NP493_49g10042 [Ridgeia piscesae]|uniref:TauD/TfdA-like domain-containing protein n=1 Tax=Ridgeia piscesae TaxID=27915 RepID=A0AAD9PB52_RIDPI|nr:hypothetical protein NP493_49g10042 [Ridgeia piscesae]